MREENFLVCSRVSGDAPIRGSIIAPCSICSRDVWIAPSGQEIFSHGEHTIICVPCGIVKAEREPAPFFNRPTPAQVGELREELRRRE